MRERFPAVYIVASRRNGTLYIGVTSDLPGRIWQHREGTIPGFSKLYGCKLLVWFEAHDTMDLAIVREKQLKEWRRGWKLKLIEAGNPEWQDLFSTLFWGVGSSASRRWVPAFAGMTGGAAFQYFFRLPGAGRDPGRGGRGALPSKMRGVAGSRPSPG